MGSVFWLLAAMLVMTAGRRYSEEFLALISIHKLPEGEAAPQFPAAAIALTTLVAVVLTFNFIALAFTRRDEVSENVQDFVDQLVRLSVFCGLIAGLDALSSLPADPAGVYRPSPMKWRWR